MNRLGKLQRLVQTTCLAIILIVIFPPLESAGQELAVREQLSALKKTISSQRSSLDLITEDQKKIDNNLEILASQIVEKAEHKEELEVGLKTIKSRLGVISSSAVRGQAIMDEQRNLFKQRASGLYKIFRGGSMLDFVFTSKQSDQLARRLRYATLLAEHDKSNLRRFGDLVRALNRERTNRS